MNINLSKKIIISLYFESLNKYTSINYRFGFFRAAYVVIRALISRQSLLFDFKWAGLNDKNICVVFFKNELNAAIKNKKSAGIDDIIEININKLNFLVVELGLVNVLRELLFFYKVSIQTKGWGIINKSSYPALGWILYIYFKKKFDENNLFRLVSFNLVHPSSLGVAWAAYAADLKLDYCEHASTTELMLSNVGIYNNYYVEYRHTQLMLSNYGIKLDSVFLLRDINIKYIWPPLGVVRVIGICINDLDSIAAIEIACRSLQNFDCSVVLRVHDADRRFLYFNDFAIKNNFKIESARNSTIEEFLGEIDLLIAGNSNVVGDALNASKPVIYFWSGDSELFDYYGFVKFYNLKHAANLISLSEILSEIQ